MSNLPDNFNDAAFERVWGRDEPEDKRNEDEIIESRLMGAASLPNEPRLVRNAVAPALLNEEKVG